MGLSNIAALTSTVQKKIDNPLFEGQLSIFKRIPKVPVDQLRKEAAYRDKSGLQTFLSQQTNKIGSNLYMYPQWIGKLAVQSREKQQKQARLDNLYKRLSNKNDQAFIAISQMNPKSLAWDQTSKQWRGKGIFLQA